jgi:hypothetical protein
MWRSGWMSYFSCIQIYGCATRGTKFLHICEEITTAAYLVTAQNCSGHGIYLDVHTREGFSATEWQYASFDSEYMIQIDR